jgi:PAS domain S-box-containing protein
MHAFEKHSIAQDNRQFAVRPATSSLATREQAVEAFERAEAKYRSIVENAVEGIFQTTPDGAYLSANPALARIYGYASPEELRQSIGDIERQLYVDLTRREDFVHLMEQDGVVTGFESEIYRKDGSVIWISENARAVRDPLGSIEYYEGTVIDISARKESERLQSEKQAAEAANRAKSQFLAHMSHELRTPLNGVIGMLDLLRETALSDQQQRYATIARSSADLLLGIINQILDLSKIEAGKLELEQIDFELRPLIEAAMEMLGSKARQKGLELTLDMAPELSLTVQGDPQRLQQVIVNLLSNAVKFTERGHVLVRVALETQADDALMLCVSVEDTGLGIPEDRLNRLFRPFSQVDASTTRQFGGTGLGLAISKEIVELMGGRIGVRSQMNAGSAFWFRVPLLTQPQPAPIRCVPPTLEGMRILAVDDNATNREILFRQLSAWRFRVELAPDGPTALAMLYRAAENNRGFALVLLDGDMPGINGYELARKIHCDTQLRSIPLVMLTSLAAQPDDADALKIGIADCLTKPIRQSALFDAIVNVASRHDLHCSPDVRSSPAALDGSQPLCPSQIPGVGTALATRKGSCPVGTPPGQSRRDQVRLLLAEDNEINQVVTLEILASAGFRCEIAQNGKEAIHRLLAQSFDAVLMDCQMPEMDGLAATREIRRLEAQGLLPERNGRLPIIALTANAVEGDREACLAAGMDEYMSKPLNAVRLVDLLEALVSAETESSSTIAVSDDTRDEPLAIDAFANCPPPVDLPQLQRRCGGKMQLVLEMLTKFAERLPRDESQLRAALDEREYRRAAQIAHAIKGTAANLSANRLRDTAGALELACRKVEGLAIPVCLEALRREADACLSFIDNSPFLRQDLDLTCLEQLAAE